MCVLRACPGCRFAGASLPDFCFGGKNRDGFYSAEIDKVKKAVMLYREYFY